MQHHGLRVIAEPVGVESRVAGSLVVRSKRDLPSAAPARARETREPEERQRARGGDREDLLREDALSERFVAFPEAELREVIDRPLSKRQSAVRAQDRVDVDEVLRAGGAKLLARTQDRETANRRVIRRTLAIR